MNCWNCGNHDEALQAASGFLICSKCNAPNYAGADRSPFAVLGAPKRFDLNLAELEKRYLVLSRWLHPDHAARMGSAWKIKCGEFSALLNEAYLALKNEESRLDALLQQSSRGKEDAKNAAAQIPQEFAERFFEVQETAFEDPAGVKELAERLKGDVSRAEDETAKSIAEIAKKTDWKNIPEQSSVAALKDLRTKRSYLRSLRSNLEKLAS